jgi:hypothetical protein
MKIYESKYGDVKYDQAHQAVVITWNGIMPTSEEYRKTLTAALDAADRYEIRHWVSDMRKERVVKSDDNKWVQETVIPTAIKKGFKKCAFLVPESVFAKMHADKLKQSIEGHGFEIQYFEDMDKLWGWLS